MPKATDDLRGKFLDGDPRRYAGTPDSFTLKVVS
jgi:hypothetical protein